MIEIKLIEDKKRETCTVKELILGLMKIENQDALIATEGCDCYGEAVILQDNGKEVLINRR